MKDKLLEIKLETINLINNSTNEQELLKVKADHLGKNSKSKGWFEGLKIGLGISILYFLISFVGFESFTLKNI